MICFCCSCRDEGVHWGIQNGLYLSRSTIVYFKHNNMESLQSTLEKVTLDNKRAKKLRRYIVVEAVYQVSLVNYVLIDSDANLTLNYIQVALEISCFFLFYFIFWFCIFLFSWERTETLWNIIQLSIYPPPSQTNTCLSPHGREFSFSHKLLF